ncbi:hypothetical protein BKA70DRAFT_1451811 [Coprinopsis sp. MPI-PUGE-AT-0042]|nr:hypothetical protein BKA70DRAFT_1451811 [Coprinopsis sp. MPI-PUGE-AT-0042]
MSHMHFRCTSTAAAIRLSLTPDVAALVLILALALFTPLVCAIPSLPLSQSPYHPFVASFSSKIFSALAEIRDVVQKKDTKQAYWENLRPGEHCLRYSTRDYTAILAGVPYRETFGTCRETAAEIHGAERLPNFCQDLGLRAGVWGHWIITNEELDCITTWSAFSDEGCRTNFEDVSIRPLRRFKASLQGLHPSDRWEIMCATTPAFIEGVDIPSPSLCTKDGETVFGSWDIEDTRCDSFTSN